MAIVNRNPSIFDMDIGKDPDDSFVAVMAALNLKQFDPVLCITNDEASSRGRARFLTTLLNSLDMPLPIAAGLPSEKNREDTLVERAGLVSFNCGYYLGSTEMLSRTLSMYDKVNYFGLGALSNLANLLEVEPQQAEKINLVQMGMNFNGAFERATVQYNVRLDVDSFKAVLEVVDKPSFLMTHSSWGSYDGTRDGRQQFGVYVGDPLYEALKDSDEKGHNLLAKHIEVWKDDGKPCSIMHDPLTVLGAYDDSIVDYVEGDVVFADDGRADLTKESHEALKEMDLARTEKLSAYLDCKELVSDGMVKRVRYSLGVDYDKARDAFVECLFGESKPNLAREWKEFNSTH